MGQVLGKYEVQADALLHYTPKHKVFRLVCVLTFKVFDIPYKTKAEYVSLALKVAWFENLL